MSVTLIMILLQLFVYVQTHQIVHIKYVHFFVYQLYFNKLLKMNAQLKHFHLRDRKSVV